MSSVFRAPEWVLHTTIYEVNLRQYTPEGTLQAFAAHLARLKDMGVHTLWFMPLQPVGIKNRKGTLGSYYSIRDYVKVNPEFGTEEDFAKLVHQAHAMGFKIIIDWVANHTAWDHVWTKTHPEFYSQDHHGQFMPPYPDWEDVIHLNYRNELLWDKMIEAMHFWVREFDIDGFRCDMAHLVPLDFWHRARTALDNEKTLFWLAETEEPLYHQVFDATYTWEFLHRMEAYWRKETNIEGLVDVLNKYEYYFPKDALRIYFTSNHDENSHSGSEYERMGDAAHAFAVLCATWKGIPLIYSGQELPNKKRLAFFEKDPIEWLHPADVPANGLHHFYKTLLHLHRTHPAMAALHHEAELFRVHTSEASRVFSFARKIHFKEVLVVLNLSGENGLSVMVNDDRITGAYRNVFSDTIHDFNLTKKLSMEAWDYLVFEK